MATQERNTKNTSLKTEGSQKERAKFGVDLKSIQYEKMTARSLKVLIEQEMKLARSLVKDTKPGQVAPEFILDLTKDIHRLGEKRASEYISMNKTILLSDHALRIKQQDLFRLRDLAEDYEDMVATEEKKFDNDVLNFNAFVQNSNAATNEAEERALHEGQLRMKRQGEAKDLRARIFLIKSDIATMERLLTEYLLCYQFLRSSAPRHEEWKRLSLIETESTLAGLDQDFEYSIDNVLNSGDLDPVIIPFENAAELLQAITRFRDQNLTIMTNSHYLKNTSADLETKFFSVSEKLQAEINDYEEEIAKFEKRVKEDLDREVKLKEVAQGFIERSAFKEKHHLETLTPQLAVTYELCTHIKATTINLTMMVMAVESHLLHLLQDISKIPEKQYMKIYKKFQWQKKVSKKTADEERRAKAQEERLKLTNLRRFDTPQQKLQRRLNYQPQLAMEMKKKEMHHHEESVDIGDDHTYFFVP